MKNVLHQHQKILKYFSLKSYAELSIIHVIYLVATGNPVNSYLTFTLDETHHGPVIAPFAMQALKCLLQFF